MSLHTSGRRKQGSCKLQNWLHGNISSIVTIKQSLIIGFRSNILKLGKQTDAKSCFEIGEHKIQMISDAKLLVVKIDDKLQ